jgi:hypothetical protein
MISPRAMHAGRPSLRQLAAARRNATAVEEPEAPDWMLELEHEDRS